MNRNFSLLVPTSHPAIIFLLALSTVCLIGLAILICPLCIPQQMQVDYVRVYSGSFGRLVGAKQVETDQTADVVYSLVDGLEDFTIVWEVPLGATFTVQTSTIIAVAFGISCGGLVTATAVSSSCGVTKSFTIPVVVNSATSTEVGDCNDGIDNDCDGLTDCDDFDCSAYPACVVCNPSTEVCNDGIDNDCDDGSVDCNDSDCAGDTACNAGCASQGTSCGADAECCSNKFRGGSCRSS
jgi:hypothetical protein